MNNTMEQLAVRTFQPADRSGVIALWRACELVVPWNDPDSDIDRKLRVNPELFLVGHRGAELVATVMGGYDGHRGWINYLAVRPDLQGRGYGREIMQSVEARLTRLGCAKINLQVRQGNEAVVQFYRHLGYSVDNVIGLGKRIVHDAAED